MIIFSQTKNKTAIKPTLKRLQILTSDFSNQEILKGKQYAKKGFASGIKL